MIRKSDKLVEATMLALQGKLELKENRVSRKTKKSEGIDVNVDDNTTVSVEGNETIVDTQDATVIVNKKEDTFVPETSDDVPMEAPVEEPTVDAPVVPDDDMVEVPADDTVMPEEVVDEPVDTELPTEESKKFESVEIEVSDDGKEVEVTTDNGEEVEVKDETPEENEDDEVEDTETEVPADDEPSIDEMIEESKKVEKVNTDNAEINNAIANPQLKANREKIRKAGYKTDKKSVTNPRNGRTFQTKYAPNKDKIDWRNRLEKDKTDYEAVVGPESDKIPNSRKISQRYNTAVYSKADADAYGVKYGPKGECDKVVEDTEEYLEPRYDSRASFYKKAKVVTKDNGDEELYSYGTHVGGVRGGKPYSKGRFSQTTSRHQKEFFKQRGVDPNKVDVEETKTIKVKGLRKIEGIRAIEEYDYEFEDLYDIVGENGKSVLNDIKKANKIDEFIDYINSIMGEDTGKLPTVGEVSDFIDYDFETIFRDLEIKTEGKQADRNKEEIEAKKCSNCIKHENKARSKKVQEMIARRQKKSEALNRLNKTVKRHRAILEHKKVENKNDLSSVEKAMINDFKNINSFNNYVVSKLEKKLKFNVEEDFNLIISLSNTSDILPEFSNTRFLNDVYTKYSNDIEKEITKMKKVGFNNIPEFSNNAEKVNWLVFDIIYSIGNNLDNILSDGTYFKNEIDNFTTSLNEAKTDLNINEGTPKKEEPIPNTKEASLKVEHKFSSKSFNEALTKYYKDKILAVESVKITKLSKTRTGLKIEANLLSKSGKLKRAICLEAKQIQTGKSFDKYEIIETKGLVKENKSESTKTTMTTFTNKQNIIECRYILTK